MFSFVNCYNLSDMFEDINSDYNDSGVEDVLVKINEKDSSSKDVIIDSNEDVIIDSNEDGGKVLLDANKDSSFEDSKNDTTTKTVQEQPKTAEIVKPSLPRCSYDEYVVYQQCLQSKIEKICGKISFDQGDQKKFDNYLRCSYNLRPQCMPNCYID